MTSGSKSTGCETASKPREPCYSELPWQWRRHSWSEDKKRDVDPVSMYFTKPLPLAVRWWEPDGPAALTSTVICHCLDILISAWGTQRESISIFHAAKALLFFSHWEA